MKMDTDARECERKAFAEEESAAILGKVMLISSFPGPAFSTSCLLALNRLSLVGPLGID